MGDVVSTHLDEPKRHYVAEKTVKVLEEFKKSYEQQYNVALFNKIRYEVEGSGGPQSQLLIRKPSKEAKTIFSGNLFQYLEENKKWRNRFFLIPDNYSAVCYETKVHYERGLHPKAVISCAGYKVLTSVDQYLELLNTCLPGLKVKPGSTPFIKYASQFPIILWHPYGRHHYFCVLTEKEQHKWVAVFQDCVRYSNDGLPEESKVETPAFTDAVRLYRQARDQYGTWEMLCGNQVQILSNLVMEDLQPELRNMISPRLKGKVQERQRAWIQISDAVYRLVQDQIKNQYDILVRRCEDGSTNMESAFRTDMDQIITSKEHVTNKIKAFVLPKSEVCVRNHVQPYISSILEALMIPTSQGFAEVRDLFFKEVIEMNKNVVNEGGKEKLGEYMEKLSQLAYHPVKMQGCYEKMDNLHLEGLQQRFDVSSTAVFKQRAQILMKEQMDNAVFTFEQLLHQDLGNASSKEEICKAIQRIQDRVLKKYDYDSSTVRKKFFREALLQIIIPFLLKKLSPTCKSELPKFQEFIFEDFAKCILVENVFEEVVLMSVMKDINSAVKEAAVQRRHNLYRDSIVINSDPSLQLLGEGVPIDWNTEFSEQAEPVIQDKRKRMKQVVSTIIQDDLPLALESCIDVPAHEGIQEEPDKEVGEMDSDLNACPKSPDSVNEIRGMLTKVVTLETKVPTDQVDSSLSNGSIVQEVKEVKEEATKEVKVEAMPPANADAMVSSHCPENKDAHSQDSPAVKGEAFTSVHVSAPASEVWPKSKDAHGQEDSPNVQAEKVSPVHFPIPSLESSQSHSTESKGASGQEDSADFQSKESVHVFAQSWNGSSLLPPEIGEVGTRKVSDVVINQKEIVSEVTDSASEDISTTTDNQECSVPPAEENVMANVQPSEHEIISSASETAESS
ncbi:protein Niban 2-like [Protopterus annectens]|uniref:protein Niban 2-like n=1 Tax=Protopterus annectens TaxID=7888 RepID=UPI001CFA611C|nr:protein Niban 2-like [Protopterus annectens]